METTQIKCLLLPLANQTKLVIPNNLVAEILFDQTAQQSADIKPSWMIGHISWRGQNLPLLSFEELCNITCGSAPNTTGHCVVLHSLKHREELPFFAIRISSVPSFEYLDESSLSEAFENRVESPFVEDNVYINGLTSIIPNLDAIADLLATRVINHG